MFFFFKKGVKKNDWLMEFVRNALHHRNNGNSCLELLNTRQEHYASRRRTQLPRFPGRSCRRNFYAINQALSLHGANYPSNFVTLS